jgi:hypothetical protein
MSYFPLFVTVLFICTVFQKEVEGVTNSAIQDHIEELTILQLVKEFPALTELEVNHSVN